MNQINNKIEAQFVEAFQTINKSIKATTWEERMPVVEARQVIRVVCACNKMRNSALKPCKRAQETIADPREVTKAIEHMPEEAALRMPFIQSFVEGKCITC